MVGQGGGLERFRGASVPLSSAHQETEEERPAYRVGLLTAEEKRDDELINGLLSQYGETVGWNLPKSERDGALDPFTGDDGKRNSYRHLRSMFRKRHFHVLAESEREDWVDPTLNPGTLMLSVGFSVIDQRGMDLSTGFGSTSAARPSHKLPVGTRTPHSLSSAS